MAWERDNIEGKVVLLLACGSIAICATGHGDAVSLDTHMYIHAHKTAASDMYLHVAPPGRHDLGIVHSHLTLWHLVQALVDDAHALTHLLHPTQVPAHGGRWGK